MDCLVVEQKSRGRHMIRNGQSLTQLLGWLIIGTKGGKTRAQIIQTVKTQPLNANQLSVQLNVDYKTIRYHLSLLKKNKVIVAVGEKYSTVYFLSEMMEENYPLFEQITSKLNQTKQQKRYAV